MPQAESSETKNFYADKSQAEIEALLGIQPLRIFIRGDPADKLQDQFLQRFEKILPQTRGQVVTDSSVANTIFFPGTMYQKQKGMWDYRKEFSHGVSGVFIGSIPSIALDTDMTEFTWRTLGNAFTQYGTVPVGDIGSGQIRSIHTISMEGAYPITLFESEEDAAMLEVVERITHLAGGSKVTKWDVDRALSPSLYEDVKAPYEIIEAGRNLRSMGLLPDIRLENYVDVDRAREIRTFLEVSGLSIGNLSAWENGMHVTGSGFNKGDLHRDQIVWIKGFNKTIDGTEVWALSDSKRVKPSVETFDQLLVYMMGVFMKAGYLSQPNLEVLLNLAGNKELNQQVLAEYSPIHKCIIHLHVQPEEWNKSIFQVIYANPYLVKNGKFHSSCGTRPLALYTTEQLMRAVLENPELIAVAVLPNHGVFIASPYELPKTVEMLDPKAKHIEFGKVVPI